MSSFRSISRSVPPTSVSRASTRNASSQPYGRSPAFRRLLSNRPLSPSHGASIKTSDTPAPLPLLRSQFLPSSIRPVVPSQSRSFHITAPSRQDVKSESKAESKAQTESAKAEAAAEEDQAKTQEEPKDEGSEKKAEGEEGEGEKKDEKKDDLPPPPPHGDKTPWQVFMETMQTEFNASKEWNDSTKQLAQGATDFVESESVRRAREAYEKTTGAVSSTAGAVLKNTAGAVGKGAAWTWDTSVMKGVRKAANVTGEALDKTTKPIRDTEAFKSVKSVIDDGSSSRYGGWVDKEERKRQRELREQMEGFKKHEVIEEDPNAGTNVTLHKDAQWKEAWKNFRDQNKFVQGVFGMKDVYNESENPLILTARSITDRVAGFFAENETAMVIKKFRSMDPAFQVEPFLRELREYILPEVLDAYVKGDVATLKLWLSEAQYSVYEAITKQYMTAGLKTDGRILDIRHVDILKARMLDPGEIPVFIITARTQEVHVYRNAKTNKLAAGMEDKVQLVTYAIGITRTPEDVNNPETRGWRLIEMQKSAREYI
ncbi:protein translocase subunit [Gnomoniopsis smithogilvyi]|uniref:Mitochondrial import inner membrane translocase subunit TIM44 n=1 Tax=Gnomoniopsis smithogilvyi TaxID=1191159 RepID=A0A9W8YZ19_9PEZI|nr:protein translocase subunit [Gnomoniopsis smithogilvyi]